MAGGKKLEMTLVYGACVKCLRTVNFVFFIYMEMIYPGTDQYIYQCESQVSKGNFTHPPLYVMREQI